MILAQRVELKKLIDAEIMKWLTQKDEKRNLQVGGSV